MAKSVINDERRINKLSHRLAHSFLIYENMH